MYHQITPSPASVYDRTPDDFRAELQRLARENYVPVTADEYATGHIDIPAGTHPVVLTLDDGSSSQFSLDASGKPAPDTAVGILLDTASQHPGFRPVAVQRRGGRVRVDRLAGQAERQPGAALHVGR